MPLGARARCSFISLPLLCPAFPNLNALFLTMELKLVYRGLRQVSDWALRFYSDVYVDGIENVPRDGPIILCVCPVPSS